MSKLTNFVKEVTARLKGDENGVIAAKNERKATSAINGQLAALRAKQVDDENAVEEAKDKLADAKYPTTLITDNKSYLQTIKYAQEAFDNATDTLKQTNDSIAYFEALLKEFEA